MVYGNQQQNHKLFVKVTIFVIISLYIFLTLTIKFDLKILQLNIINAFVYANLDKTVFIKISLKYI